MYCSEQNFFSCKIHIFCSIYLTPYFLQNESLIGFQAPYREMPSHHHHFLSQPAVEDRVLHSHPNLPISSLNSNSLIVDSSTAYGSNFNHTTARQMLHWESPHATNTDDLCPQFTSGMSSYGFKKPPPPYS